MATGIVLSIGASITATYTAKSNAKLAILAFGTVTFNGGTLSVSNTNNLYIGAGQTVTIVTSSASAAVITQYEE